MEKKVIEEKVVSFFEDECGVEMQQVDFDTPILGTVIDSIEILKLIIFIDTEFSVQFQPFEVNIDNFDSVNKISALIDSKLNS